jgi:hypothetical protein
MIGESAESGWLQRLYGDLGYLASDSVRLGFESHLEATDLSIRRPPD